MQMYSYVCPTETKPPRARVFVRVRLILQTITLHNQFSPGFIVASHRIALPIHSAGYKVLQGIRPRRRTSTRTALRTQHTRPNLPSPDVYCSIQTDGHHETKLQVHESAPTLVIDTTGRDIKSPTNTQHRHQHQHQQTSTQNGLTRAIDTSKSQILSRNIASQPACSISLSQP